MIKVRVFKEPQAYSGVFEAMRTFTLERDEHTPDEIWFMEHKPVFTQGQAGKPEHILNPHNIPVVQSDRGGQVTYHGPGQLMSYLLVDVRRANLGVKSFVCLLEKAHIQVLKDVNLHAKTLDGAPGVYLEDGSKIASIGIRIRKGCAYHGSSFNLNCDLSPFSMINPCGFKQLKVTRVCDHANVSMEQMRERLLREYEQRLGLKSEIISLEDSISSIA